MQRIYRVAIIVGLTAAAAAAQDEGLQREKLRMEVEHALVNSKTIRLEAGVMSNPVKNAPYTADEVMSTNQVLTDGTNIHNENTATVYRDAEGRVRRESAEEVVLFDPVAKSRYAWTSNKSTGTKTTLGFTKQLMIRTDGDRTVTFHAMGGSGAGVGVGTGMGTATAAVAAGAAVSDDMLPPPPPGGPNFIYLRDASGGPTQQVTVASPEAAQTEQLGSQVMEGLTVQGTRTTTTIEAGAIGNDRPIHIVTERWYSPDLQTVVMTKTTDPRTGEQTFQLRNVRRGDPDPSLFQPPANMQLNERK
jgi:hypothetical protein